jgi:L-alanine-DL-glutamate epimerase-like enolase superfamily enzyme
VALAGVATRAVRYVVSFARRADAATEAARLLAAAPGLELKVDADPAWGDAVWAGLAGLGAVAVLDFKGTGAAADAERAHDLLPEALIEDPAGPPASWSAALRRRVSLDAAVRHAADVAALPARPAAVNVKPARLGGVLEALRTIAACQADEVAVYVGGMFEVGIGRAQLRALAAVFSPDGPNDIAPIGVGSAPAPRPRALAVDPTRPGFGGCTLGPSPGPC